MDETMTRPDRCVMIMNKDLDRGHMANAIAVVALTVGQRHPYLVGETLVDADGVGHPGLIPIGIPMLQCEGAQLRELRAKAKEKGFDVIDFPKQGQATKDYSEFLRMMQAAHDEELEYLGLAIVGKKNAVNRITKHCEML